MDKAKQSWKSASLEVGKTVNIGVNRVINFKITTSGGTVIEGIIPANEYLSITNGGDITGAEMNIYDIPEGPSEVI